MSGDDPINKLTDSSEDGKATQPTLTAIFRLLREVQDGQTKLTSRFDALETRLARDFAGVDARFAEMSDEMKAGLLRLSDKLCDRIDRSRLHAESDYEDLLRRLRKLESRAS